MSAFSSMLTDSIESLRNTKTRNGSLITEKGELPTESLDYILEAVLVEKDQESAVKLLELDCFWITNKIWESTLGAELLKLNRTMLKSYPPMDKTHMNLVLTYTTATLLDKIQEADGKTALDRIHQEMIELKIKDIIFSPEGKVEQIQKLLNEIETNYELIRLLSNDTMENLLYLANYSADPSTWLEKYLKAQQNTDHYNPYLLFSLANSKEKSILNALPFNGLKNVENSHMRPRNYTSQYSKNLSYTEMKSKYSLLLLEHVSSQISTKEEKIALTNLAASWQGSVGGLLYATEYAAKKY